MLQKAYKTWRIVELCVVCALLNFTDIVALLFLHIIKAGVHNLRSSIKIYAAVHTAHVF